MSLSDRRTTAKCFAAMHFESKTYNVVVCCNGVDILHVDGYLGSNPGQWHCPSMAGFNDDDSCVTGFKAKLRQKTGAKIVENVMTFFQVDEASGKARDAIRYIVQDKSVALLLEAMLKEAHETTVQFCKERGIPEPDILQITTPVGMDELGKSCLQYLGEKAGWAAVATDFTEIQARAYFTMWTEMKARDCDRDLCLVDERWLVFGFGGGAVQKANVKVKQDSQTMLLAFTDTSPNAFEIDGEALRLAFEEISNPMPKELGLEWTTAQIEQLCHEEWVASELKEWINTVLAVEAARDNECRPTRVVFTGGAVASSCLSYTINDLRCNHTVLPQFEFIPNTTTAVSEGALIASLGWIETSVELPQSHFGTWRQIPVPTDWKCLPQKGEITVVQPFFEDDAQPPTAIENAKGKWIPLNVTAGAEFVLKFGRRKQNAKLKSLKVRDDTYHDLDSYILLGELGFTLLEEHDKLLQLKPHHTEEISFCLKFWRPTKSSIMWAVYVNADGKLKNLHTGSIKNLWEWGPHADREKRDSKVLKRVLKRVERRFKNKPVRRIEESREALEDEEEPETKELEREGSTPKSEPRATKSLPRKRVKRKAISFPGTNPKKQMLLAPSLPGLSRVDGNPEEHAEAGETDGAKKNGTAAEDDAAAKNTKLEKTPQGLETAETIESDSGRRSVNEATLDEPDEEAAKNAEDEEEVAKKAEEEASKKVQAEERNYQATVQDASDSGE